MEAIRTSSTDKICSPSFLKKIVVKIKNDPSWPRNYECLTKYNSWDWRPALNDIIEFADIQKNDRNRLRTYACIACNVWDSSIKESKRPNSGSLWIWHFEK